MPDLIIQLFLLAFAVTTIYLYAKNKNLSRELFSTKEKYKEISNTEDYIKQLKSDLLLKTQQKKAELQDIQTKIIKLQENAKLEAAAIIKDREQETNKIKEHLLSERNKIQEQLFQNEISTTMKFENLYPKSKTCRWNM